MIEGNVNVHGVPIIELEIAGRSWVATVDTGFNGFLELPYLLGASVNPRHYGYGMSVLAGGVIINEEQYKVDFPFDGRIIVAIATFVAGDGILLGTRLFEDYRLTIDFPAESVLLEREE